MVAEAGCLKKTSVSTDKRSSDGKSVYKRRSLIHRRDWILQNAILYLRATQAGGWYPKSNRHRYKIRST